MKRCEKLNLPASPNVFVVQNADLMQFALAIATRDKRLFFQHVILLLDKF